jgi:peroxiredoxin Q/BCP
MAEELTESKGEGMKLVPWIALAGLLAAGPVLAQDEKMEAPALKAGDTAPAFSLPGTDGKTHSLEEFKGKKAVVIAWFPKAFTGG